MLASLGPASGAVCWVLGLTLSALPCLLSHAVGEARVLTASLRAASNSAQRLKCCGGYLLLFSNVSCGPGAEVGVAFSQNIVNTE